MTFFVFGCSVFPGEMLEEYFSELEGEFCGIGAVGRFVISHLILQL